jgi:hypothetical protein
MSLINNIKNAIIFNNYRELSILLDECEQLDCNINEFTNGHNAMYLAVDSGNLSMIDLLIKYGADLNTVNIKGDSALTVAIKNEDLKTIYYLVEKGIAIPYDIISILAIHQVPFEIIEYFLKLGADGGPTKELIQERMLRENVYGEIYYFDDDELLYDEELLKLLDRYDIDIKHPGFD